MVNSWLKPGLEEKISQPSLRFSLAFPVGSAGSCFWRLATAEVSLRGFHWRKGPSPRNEQGAVAVAEVVCSVPVYCLNE